MFWVSMCYNSWDTVDANKYFSSFKFKQIPWMMKFCLSTHLIKKHNYTGFYWTCGLMFLWGIVCVFLSRGSAARQWGGAGCSGGSCRSGGGRLGLNTWCNGETDRNRNGLSSLCFQMWAVHIGSILQRRRLDVFFFSPSYESCVSYVVSEGVFYIYFFLNI